MQIYFLQPSLIIFSKGANHSNNHCTTGDWEGFVGYRWQINPH